MEPDPILTFDEFRTTLKTKKFLPKYDSSAEPKPELPWWQMDRAALDGELKEFSETIRNLLEGYPDSDSELKHLHSTAPNLGVVLRSRPIKVALVGMHGTGKSLSTNAVFDREGLSFTGSKGSSCTSAVIRYTHYPSTAGEATRYYAHIKFLDDAKREAMLKEHARNYYFYHNADDNSDDEDGDVGREEPDKMMSETAEAVFKTLFGSKDMFLASWNAPDFKSGEFVSLCKLKCREALKKHGIISDSNVLTKDADQPQELMQKLKPFVTTLDTEISFAPLVDHVTIHFTHELLEAGIEFIDLPGWGDINQSRARHAEEVKDTVDAQIMLADTIRVADDMAFINKVRGAIAHHGSGNVKVVATKTDVLTDTDLKTYVGGQFDKINTMIAEVDQEVEKAAEEEDDEDGEEDDDHVNKKKRDPKELEAYSAYLQRCLKQTIVAARSADIDDKLAEKLRDRARAGIPETFHTSPSEYMNWLAKPKIRFAKQPALSPTMTGLPALRQSLYALPAQQNLKDYERHVNITIPAFLEKLKRTATDTERDGGFVTLADEFDVARKAFMAQMLKQAKAAFQGCSKDGLVKMKFDLITFKDQVEELVSGSWFSHKGKAWETILKRRGTILPGMSQAKALKSGVDWNGNLARILEPGFYKWSNTHSACMKIMEPALIKSIDQLHHKVIAILNDSSANLVTVDKTKRKWEPLRHIMQVKMKTLMNQARELEKDTLSWAAQEYARDNNLIASVTDNIYIEVLQAEPERKPSTTNKKGKEVKRFVEPKIPYQKKQMERLMLDPTNHFVDKVNNHFRSHFDEKMRILLEDHFALLDNVLSKFSADLRSEAPINYRITDQGKAIRADVCEQIPKLEEMAKELRKRLPVSAKQEAQPNVELVNEFGSPEEGEEKLSEIYDKIAKKRKAEPPAPKRSNKKIKQESL